MAAQVSTAHLDYLQRSDLELSYLRDSAGISQATPELRRLSRIAGIGRLEKKLTPGTPGQTRRLVSEDLLIGLYGYKLPVAFLVRGALKGVSINIGTWSPAGRDNASAAIMDARNGIVESCLNSLYPAIDLAPSQTDFDEMSNSGLAMGIPTAKPSDMVDDGAPVDRLIRSLTNANWAVLILAEPLHESTTSGLRDSVINEIRIIQAAIQSAQGPSPLAQHYLDLLQALLKSLTSGQAIGCWRTGVHLLGDTISYYRLASIWRGIFSGADSSPEPVRVWDSPMAAALAAKWAMPDLSGVRGPGEYQHPFQYQTVLTSAQLAAYIHLPQLETSGFTIRTVPDFDVVPPAIKDKQPALSLGQVIHRNRPTPAEYAILPNSLTRHAFVAGVTGSGKTNTLFHILKQALSLDIPFLVIEPAKTEYRELLQDPALKGKLQVFTLGNENASPLRLNPFEVLPGIPVGVHLDLLRSVFSVSFGLWSVLPAVLELCLLQIYEDRGWDIATNTNHRLDKDSDPANAFPTLTDLAAKVDVMSRALEYDAESEATIRAALLTRINSLRGGSKGRMLDVQRSIPMSVLLQRPTILELEGIGDDDDKAFLMGLLFVRLVEFRRAAGATANLVHLMVIEEAHRLLSGVDIQSRQQEANARGKAVETFAHLLSEIRAYGQGVIIVDQVPGKLIPDVMKNTNLKMAHRVVSVDDRQTLAGAMAMNDRQQLSLASLTVGQAAVFSDGDDSPVLVQVPSVKSQLSEGRESNVDVSKHMASSRTVQDQAMFLPFPFCAQLCNVSHSICKVAKTMMDDQQFQSAFAHVVLSSIENTDALDRNWDNLLTLIEERRPANLDWQQLLRCFFLRATEWFTQRRGAQSSWTYTQTEELADRLRLLFLAKIINEESGPQRGEFQKFAYALHTRTFDPFPICSRVCDQQPPVCLYRSAVADLIAGGRYTNDWYTAESTDSSEDGYPETWKLCSQAAYKLIETPGPDWPEPLSQSTENAARRVGLCFAQQMVAADGSKTPQTKKWVLERLLEESIK